MNIAQKPRFDILSVARQWDKDQDNRISVIEIQQAFAKFNVFLTNKEVGLLLNRLTKGQNNFAIDLYSFEDCFRSYDLK